MKQSLLPIALAAGLSCTVPLAAEAKPPVVLMAGSVSDRHVSFSFENANNPLKSVLRISTHRVGNPGAKLAVSIDNNTSPLLSVFLTNKECKFAAGGAECTITIAGQTKTYQRFLAAFARGRFAHVLITNAAVMEMRTDVSLTDFTKSLKS
ncbi:hypothetical protein GR223_21105 [Rhizobium leguminosarum]|jgi:hypothetical protein|uniref:hypothetical protein n=1 Tax=Rhizobium ruizarguesonis TaxID=2081791 RepID=UPI0013E0C8C1|nr:hypothetical protein [Rhizobium ruizarguesonis]NEJ88423.1 hypothetical protein [Rhizobium ruizarguesonis]